MPSVDSGLFARIGGEIRKRAWFAKVTDAQVCRTKQLDVGVVEEAVHPVVVPWRVVGLARRTDDREERWTWWRGDAGVRTARRAAMVPRDKPKAGLCDEAVALACRAASRVVHGVAALPLPLDGASEDAAAVVGCAQKRGKQAILESGSGR